MTSSSDDEISLQALREATDEQFFNEKLYRRQCQIDVESSYSSDRESRPSKRVIRRFDRFENTGASQQYKNFVGNKLGEILDRQIREKRKKIDRSFLTRENQVRSRMVGIRLLNSSTTTLTEVASEKLVEERRSKRKGTNEKEDNFTSTVRCKEAAVDPQWVLAEANKRSWNNERKAAIFKYKLTDGVLLECDQ